MYTYNPPHEAKCGYLQISLQPQFQAFPEARPPRPLRPLRPAETSQDVFSLPAETYLSSPKIVCVYIVYIIYIYIHI